MKPKYKRVLLKLSGEALLPDGQSYGVSLGSAAKIASEIKPVIDQGVQVAVVVGGGNIVRGALVASGGGIGQAQADTMGMLATVINSIALQEAFERAGLKTSVMSSIAMDNVAEPFVRRKALSYIESGRIVIFAGGTGNPFFSTDSAAALRALEIEAQVILKGTKVDGVYTADPMKDAKATRFEKLTYIDVLQKQLQVMDSTAISMCMDHKLPVVVFNMFVPGNFAKAVEGTNLGTVVYG